MGCYGGPDISESGLVLSLDAANTKSYPDAVNYYSTPETLTSGRTGASSGGNYTDFTSDGPDGGRFTRWVTNTGLTRTNDWDWSIFYTNTGLSTGQPVIISFYARCPNGTLSNITLNSPDTVIVNATLDSTWRLFVGTALYGGDYVSTPFVRINRGNSNAYVNGATYDIALFKIQKGNIWTDLSGNSNTGTLVNGVGYVGTNGGSLTFDGTNDVVNANTSIIDRTNGQEITVSCWIKPSRTSGQYSVFCTNRTNDLNIYNWIFYQHTNDGAISFHGSSQNKSSYIPTINVWINVTNTVTASGASTLYVNGVSTYTVTGYTYGNGTPSRLGIGANPGGQEPFQGNISQVSIYNRALSAAEIKQNFNALRGRFSI